MDGAKFAKFCRETRLQDGKTLDSQSVDIIFSKVKPRGERRITFEEFKDAVAMVGEMRGERFRDISERVASVGGPRSRRRMGRRWTRRGGNSWARLGAPVWWAPLAALP